MSNNLTAMLRKAGNGAIWLLYYLVYLALLLPAAMTVGILVDTRISSAPGPWTAFLSGVAMAVSLTLAGLTEGPRGRLGKRLWFVWGLLAGAKLWVQAMQNPGQEFETTLRFVGHGWPHTRTWSWGRGVAIAVMVPQ